MRTMITRLKSVLRGYRSLFRSLAGRDNDGKHLEIELHPLTAVAVLAVIGWLRTILEYLLRVHIHPKWYVLDYDVIYTMMFYCGFQSKEA